MRCAKHKLDFEPKNGCPYCRRPPIDPADYLWPEKFSGSTVAEIYLEPGVAGFVWEAGGKRDDCPTIEAAKATADNALREAGWTLDNGENET